MDLIWNTFLVQKQWNHSYQKRSCLIPVNEFITSGRKKAPCESFSNQTDTETSATEVWISRSASSPPFLLCLLFKLATSTLLAVAWRFHFLLEPCGQWTLRSYGWAYWFLRWPSPPPLLCLNRKQGRFILQSAVHPRRPMIGDVYGGEKPGMTNKGWTLEWQGSASRGSVCSVDPGGHSPSARGVVSYWWHCCWFQCEGGRRSPSTIPLVK